MLQINDLTITHKKDLRELVRDFDLTLCAGDRAVIVGEEGNGKSTLLKWMHDPALIAPYAEARGQRTLSARAGYLAQETDPQALGTGVCDYLVLRAEPGRALSRALWELGLPAGLSRETRPLSSLSGGERVKLRLAALLSREPELLLLDEPSNDLDIETLEALERVILGAKCAVFISHDETLIENTANRVILLERLRRRTVCRHTVANVPFAVFAAEREAAFLKQAREAASERRDEKKALEKFRRIHDRVEHEQNVISRADPSGGRLLKKKMAAVKALERRYQREHEAMTEFPEREPPIAVRFGELEPMPAGKTVLELFIPELKAGESILSRDISLTVRGPEKICLTGRNGAGKTTLLRHISEALRDKSGIRARHMPQDYGELLSGDELPAQFLAPSGDKGELTRARELLGSMRFTFDEMSRPARELSGGQKAKLILLSMALSRPNVLLLDEPTRNFSPLSGPEVRALIKSFPGAVICVSHDRKFISEVCDRVLALDESGLRSF